MSEDGCNRTNFFFDVLVGPGGRSRSQQSSRENSVTRPQREAAQHAPLVREPSKGTPLTLSLFFFFLFTSLFGPTLRTTHILLVVCLIDEFFCYVDLLQGVSTVTEDQIARKAHSVLEEFFTNESMDVRYQTEIFKNVLILNFYFLVECRARSEGVASRFNSLHLHQRVPDARA